MKHIFNLDGLPATLAHRVKDLVVRKLHRLNRQPKRDASALTTVEFTVHPVEERRSKWEAQVQIDHQGERLSASAGPFRNPVEAAEKALEALDQLLRRRLLTRLGACEQTSLLEGKEEGQHKKLEEIGESYLGEKSTKAGRRLAALQGVLKSEMLTELASANRKNTTGWNWLLADELVTEVLLRAWSDAENGLSGPNLTSRLEELVCDVLAEALRIGRENDILPGAYPNSEMEENGLHS